MMHLLAATSPGFFDLLKNAVNAATRPQWFISISCLVFVLMFALYKFWTKPVIATILFVGFLIGYFGSMGDENFRAIVAKPDNVPITIMVISVMICIWLAFRRAALNDARVAAGLPPLEEDKGDKVLFWPA